MGEVGLGGFAVVFDRPDAAAVGDPNRDREGNGALGAAAKLRDLRDDLIECRVDESVELDLEHWAVATHGKPHGRTHDAALRERGVDDPVLAKILLQAVGNPKDAAEPADVLAHE